MFEELWDSQRMFFRPPGDDGDKNGPIEHDILFITPCMMHSSAASRARDCENPANLVALAQIRVDRAPDGTRSSRSWRRLRD